MKLKLPPRKERAETAIILRTRGDVAVAKLGKDRVEHETGTYVIEPHARFRLDKRIEPGVVSVFVEGNPEPVKESEPLGYDAKTVRNLTGGLLPHIVGAGFKGPGGPFDMNTWIIIGVVALALIITIAVVATGSFGG